MKPSRLEILEEMGFSPSWVLRNQPAVRRNDSAEQAGTVTAETSAAQSPQRRTTDDRERSAHLAAVSSEDVSKNLARMGWDELHQNIRDCRACGLCNGRKQVVPGVGDENADWLFIGEGPGAEEDARGEPFVGQAGKLLDAMLAAIDLKRGEDVYIGNAVKCRPPGNRTPEAAEMATCFPFLQRQIALIQPRLIILLGRAAVHAVLGQEGSLASLRGKNLTYRNGTQEIPVLVTYHPAYLLRNLPDKAKAWEDLCRARALMRNLRE